MEPDTVTVDLDRFNSRQVESNGITMHVVQAGDPNGPLVLLLHGFPEFWYGWQAQILALADAGYWVWAPDQRGVNLTDKPSGLDAYCLDVLADDIVGLIDGAGHQDAAIVGHDWGAAVAWWMANKAPDRVNKLVILNVPHHAVMAKALKKNRRQQKRSWYMFFFQLPLVPEQTLRARNWASLTRMLTGSARTGTFSADDLDRYRNAWSQPGAVTGMLNWYRAIMQRPPKRLPDVRIKPLTLMIWGQQDEFLGFEMAQPSIDLCDDGRLVTIEDTSHWVHHEEPERVTQLLLEFFSSATMTDGNEKSGREEV